MRKPIATSPSEGGGRKNGKKHRTLTVFPISIWAHLLTGALSDPCLSSGETGGFLWHPVRHTAAHRIKFLEKIKLQPTQDSPSPARNTLPGVGFPALLQTTSILGVGGFSQRGLQLTGFHSVSQLGNRGKDLLRA